jgi:hypothetical protein
MPFIAYFPLDQRSLSPDPLRREFSRNIEPGFYVYVLDCKGTVWIAPNGSHQHPRVLGRARPVAGAGEIQIGVDGEVTMINNESGTFQCHKDSLMTVVGAIVRQGGRVAQPAIQMLDEEA